MQIIELNQLKSFLIIAGALVLAACDATPDAQANSQQISAGKQVFEGNCLTCHGVGARGEVSNWQKPDADGKYPAPPLNGTAHAWHHNLKVLRGTIDRGGIPLGGTMPAFKDTLNEEQKDAVLAYIQSLWPEEIYQIWKKKNG